MCSHNRYIKHFAGEYIGSSDASTDHSSSCSVQSRIRSLGTAKSELHDTVSLCCINNTGSFRGNQTLVIQNREDCCFNKLGLHDRSHDFQKWFSWKDDASFRNRINISAEMESAQVMKKVFTEQSKTSQVINILIRKIQIFNIVNDLIQSCHDGISAFVWVITEENIEYNGLIFLCFKISLHHCKLVQVCQ